MVHSTLDRLSLLLSYIVEFVYLILALTNKLDSYLLIHNEETTPNIFGLFEK